MENLRNFKMQPAKPQGTEDGIFIVQAQIRVDIEQLLNSLLQSYRAGACSEANYHRQLDRISKLVEVFKNVSLKER